MVACYANRSACYLKLDMLTECRLDCQEGKQYGVNNMGAIGVMMKPITQ